ncbi:hypothetical protein [Aeoliella sp.]|uniref:hypothetical protein n=1 Tax=Aeoliella sp. TaxID=2795800 RepID=UPI003CCB798F
MDPNACYREMCDAFEEAHRQLANARERALALHGWLAKGGSYPADVPESEVRTVINQVFFSTEEADDE